MSTQDLKSRLAALEQHINKAEKHLKERGLLSHDPALTASELRQRHEVLTRKLCEEVTDAEAHGHHVSDLESSLRQLFGDLELRMD